VCFHNVNRLSALPRLPGVPGCHLAVYHVHLGSKFKKQLVDEKSKECAWPRARRKESAPNLLQELAVDVL
jgi:hypothetical protein